MAHSGFGAQGPASEMEAILELGISKGDNRDVLGFVCRFGAPFTDVT